MDVSSHLICKSTSESTRPLWSRSSITATFFPPSSMESRSIFALAAAVLASSDESSKILKKL